MTSSTDVRGRLIDVFRRDLVGPHPGKDPDLARERINENPSRWYLSGFLAPADDPLTLDDATEDSDPDEQELDVSEPDTEGAGGAAGDTDLPDAPNTRKRFLPSSIGITALLDPEVEEVDVHLSWGDYRTEPPLKEIALLPEEFPEETDSTGQGKRVERPPVDWVRIPKERFLRLQVVEGRSDAVLVPDSAAEQRVGGGLTVETHSKVFSYNAPDGSTQRVRALTVFLVNRRLKAHRFYADVSYVFQARVELRCASGFLPQTDLSGYWAGDPDLRIADLHYRDVCEFAVGRNASAGWDAPEKESNPRASPLVSRVWTDPLPCAEVERVAPNEDRELTEGVTFGMDDLAQLDAARLEAALKDLPKLYGRWIDKEKLKVAPLSVRRREIADNLIVDMERARERIAEGIRLLTQDDSARHAFQLMNRAVAEAARRRTGGKLPKPRWRPFQLAFILLNLSCLAIQTHRDREIADLLFFPTGGGKTEAYLGLAAFVIVHRRLRASGVLGAGVAVIMRYTLRLLTLDQLSRAAGVVCALELMRNDAGLVDAQGRKLLGDWPIEIGLWVGSDASPNRLGRTGDGDKGSAVSRVRRYRVGRDKQAPAPLKSCPWCGTEFTAQSFACVPTERAPTNLEIRCVNTDCDFSRHRALPILTVDEPIYRRLPAFLIATIDKFASLPWVGETGAFFGHVDRFKEGLGFFGASEPGEGRRLGVATTLGPPDLIIQDELHLISGPLGTVAGLYEASIDLLASRGVEDSRVRPKIVASTATVRRASGQIAALFDRSDTRIFPPVGIDREDSFFARTVPSSKNPARIYLGIAAQGRGPKLVFLRSLTTLLSAAKAVFDACPKTEAKDPNPADPYMTALCYFNALRELGGARRIVEDEVRDRVSRYGAQRRRIDPPDAPFSDRAIGEPLELTSRVSTDDVAIAKQRLEALFGVAGKPVDVALATNMISVGLDITRLGLMVVQGQPKTAAEYIQATSRVGRDHNRPGLVIAVLNLHKPRDRTHFEQFRQFHHTFYRAVEATSVTPWAARALDRALAATIVSAVRHIDESLTPEAAVNNLASRPDVRATVKSAFLARAPEDGIAGGRAALSALIDNLMDSWISTLNERRSSGNTFVYSKAKSPNRLLHMPLENGIDNLPPDHRLFIAGRSMRDVEPSVLMKVKDPKGNAVANADDLS